MRTDRLGWSIEIKKPLYISILVLVLALFMGASIWMIHWYDISDDRRRATIVFGVSLLVAAIALYGILKAADNIRQANAEKRSLSSMRFIERWNDPGYLSLKTEFRRLDHEISKMKREDGDALLENEVDKRTFAVEVLNFFEEMAMAANTNRIDGELLRLYFDTVVIRYFEDFEYWIRQHRIRREAAEYYTDLEKLVAEWKKARA
jgi:hypothetical protein